MTHPATARPGFSLQLEHGSGRLVLTDRPVGGWVVEVLALSLRDVPGRLDLRVGADRFRHQRTRLDRLAVALDEEALSQAVVAAAEGTPFQDLEVRISEGDVVLAGAVVAPSPVPFLCRIRPVPAGLAGERLLLISAYETRIFGPSAFTAPALAKALLTLLGLGPWLRGPTLAALDPIDRLTLEVCAALGWKAPDRRDARIEGLRCEGGRLALVAARPAASAPGPRPLPAANEAAFRERRFLEHYEACSLFAHLEARVSDGDLEAAVRGLRRQLEIHPGHAFLVGRLLQLLAPQPQSAAEVRALAGARLARFPEDVEALLALAAVRAREGAGEEAAELFERVGQLARRRGDALEAAQAAWAAAAARSATQPRAAIAAYEEALRTHHRLPGLLRALADLHERVGDRAAALRIQQRLTAAAVGPEARRQHGLRLGTMALQAGEPTLARQALEAVLAEHPDDIDALDGLASAATLEGEHLAAVQSLDRASRLLRARGDAEGAAQRMTRLGDLWATLADGAATAQLRYRQALLLVPNHAPALFGLAELARAEGDRATARARYEEVLRLGGEAVGDRAEVHLRLGRLLAEPPVEEPDLAAAHLQKALEGEPPQVEAALESLEALHRAAGRYDDVVRVLSRAVERAPDPVARAARLVRLAQVLLAHLGDRRRSVELLRQAEGLDPENLMIPEALVSLYRQAGEHAALAEALGRLALRIDDPERLCALYLERGALLRTQLNRTDEAAVAYADALGCRPTSREALAGLADVYRGQDRFAELAEVLARWARLERGHEAGWLWLELARLQADVLGRPESALASLEGAVASLPDEPEVLRRLGDLHFAAGRPDAALVHYGRLAARYAEEGYDEPAAPFLRRLAATQVAAGHEAEAVATLELAAREAPDDVATADQLQDFLLKTGEIERIARFFEGQLKRARRPEARAFLARRAGRLLWRELRKPAEAAPLLDEALRADPGDGDVQRIRLEVATALGDWARVAELLQTQLEGAPPARRPGLSVRLAQVLGGELGRRDEARALLAEVLQTRAGFEGAQALLDAWGTEEARAAVPPSAPPVAEPEPVAPSLPAVEPQVSVAAGVIEAPAAADEVDVEPVPAEPEPPAAHPPAAAGVPDGGDAAVSSEGPPGSMVSEPHGVEPLESLGEFPAAGVPDGGDAAVSSEGPPGSVVSAPHGVEPMESLGQSQAVAPAVGDLGARDFPRAELSVEHSRSPRVERTVGGSETEDRAAGLAVRQAEVAAAAPGMERARATLRLAEYHRDVLLNPEGALVPLEAVLDEAEPGSDAWTEAIEGLEDLYALRGAWASLIGLYDRRLAAGLLAPTDAHVLRAAALRSEDQLEAALAEARAALPDERAQGLEVDLLLALHRRAEAVARLLAGGEGASPEAAALAWDRAAELVADEDPAEAARLRQGAYTHAPTPERLAVWLEAARRAGAPAGIAAAVEAQAAQVAGGARAAARRSRVLLEGARTLATVPDGLRPARHLAEAALAAWPDNLDALVLFDEVLVALGDDEALLAVIDRQLAASMEGPWQDELRARRERLVAAAPGAPAGAEGSVAAVEAAPSSDGPPPRGEGGPAPASELSAVGTPEDGLEIDFDFDPEADVDADAGLENGAEAGAAGHPGNPEVDAVPGAEPDVELAAQREATSVAGFEAHLATGLETSPDAARLADTAPGPWPGGSPDDAPALDTGVSMRETDEAFTAGPRDHSATRPLASAPADPLWAMRWRTEAAGPLAVALAHGAAEASGPIRGELWARSALLRGRSAEAEAAWRRVLGEAAAPFDAVAHATLALARTADERALGALVGHLGQRLQGMADRRVRGGLLALRGWLKLERIRDLGGARADFRLAHEEVPAAAMAAAGLGALDAEAGAWPLALAALVMALKAGPENPVPLVADQDEAVFRLLVRALGALGRGAELADLAVAILDVHPTCLPALAWLDPVLSGQGAHAVLAGRIAAALEGIGRPPVDWLWRRAELLAGPLRRRAEAPEAVAAVLSLDPGHRPARRLALALAGEREAWSEYAAHAEALLAGEPEADTDPDVLRLAVARVYADLLAQPAQSLAHLRTLDARGTLPPDAVGLFLHAAREARDEAALGTALAARVRLERSLAARLALAEHHLDHGRVSEARGLLEGIDPAGLAPGDRAHHARLVLEAGQTDNG